MVAAFCDFAEHYVETQKGKLNPLWKNVLVDFERIKEWKRSNFVLHDDGSFVWIDPFLYSEFDKSAREEGQRE